MRSYGIIHILLFILLMLVYQCSKAQDRIFLANGDTLSGKLKILSFGTEKKVQLQEEGKKKETYSMFQLRGFEWDNDRFIPVKTSTSFEFMKVVKEGYLSLLGYQPENQSGYDGQYLLKRDGAGLEVPNLTFKKLVARFLADCGTVSERITSGELGKSDLNQIVDIYNGCIAERTAAQTAELTKSAETAKLKSAWTELEETVRSKDSFEGKSDALEMIADIKGKISRGEKIPKFIVEGLKEALAPVDLADEVEAALKESGS